MTLYLMRHGDYAVTAQQLDVLSKKGELETTRLAQHLAQLAAPIEVVFHSVKHRAKQTAALMVEGMGGGMPLVQRTGLAPNDEPSEFAFEINASHDKEILIVSHLPFVNRLLSTLVLGYDYAELVDFQPSTLVGIVPVRAEKWAISFVLSPKVIVDRGMG